ncbi:hypothetical protein GCM10009718_27840 [Isoptericola halotolerans]|uniref:Lipoprotein n=1 Tax=Isoptericola halotolerans TaxID=300560 RepID=A0ABX2A6Y4_9MICO|nr:hypothetical protein [Isoptericola halotolerans]NOV97366.1 hypothetical protein [Isoptericola halotolerans]
MLVVVLVGVVGALSGCGAAARDCEEAYVGSISSVEGVASVEAECSLQFGGGWQRVDVFLETNDVTEARAVGQQVLQAIATEPTLEDQWSTPRAYYLQDGSGVSIGLRELGFNGVPNVGEVRENDSTKPLG